MSSDEEQDNSNEDQIINLISTLQQKIKTNRTNNGLMKTNRIGESENWNEMRETQKEKRKINNFGNSNEFSLQREQSKHSSISENLSDFTVRTDKPVKESQQKTQQAQVLENNDILELKQKMDYLLSQREKDQEMLEQINAGLMFLISQIPKPKQTNSIGVQTVSQRENSQNQSTPKVKKTAQQTVQQMFQEPDRYAFQEIRNFCFKR
ncbi:unnamed protein product (macronuclear) [Paramecium tetraurelia]|uniref:Uncharacterized protein n=1 Tax=Paramecium tetraurelia TaxID=5888 RepID=A0CCJ2_PARTE|nr:uncharacterized protein GSPATT00037294001 [Paramecium tetraurelia]CAK68509.1 unnamed protein product [Paramecium tetraurelia]|eukprot:XP_001435906.1 hypothetical protein (macronuclear) [Paramecium tetraurelia strain d4-2]